MKAKNELEDLLLVYLKGRNGFIPLVFVAIVRKSRFNEDIKRVISEIEKERNCKIEDYEIWGTLEEYLEKIERIRRRKN